MAEAIDIGIEEDDLRWVARALNLEVRTRYFCIAEVRAADNTLEVRVGGAFHRPRRSWLEKLAGRWLPRAWPDRPVVVVQRDDVSASGAHVRERAIIRAFAAFAGEDVAVVDTLHSFLVEHQQAASEEQQSDREQEVMGEVEIGLRVATEVRLRTRPTSSASLRSIIREVHERRRSGQPGRDRESRIFQVAGWLLMYAPGRSEVLATVPDGAAERRLLQGTLDRMEADLLVVDGHRFDVLRENHHLVYPDDPPYLREALALTVERIIANRKEPVTREVKAGPGRNTRRGGRSMAGRRRRGQPHGPRGEPKEDV